MKRIAARSSPLARHPIASLSSASFSPSPGRSAAAAAPSSAFSTPSQPSASWHEQPPITSDATHRGHLPSLFFTPRLDVSPDYLPSHQALGFAPLSSGSSSSSSSSFSSCFPLSPSVPSSSSPSGSDPVPGGQRRNDGDGGISDHEYRTRVGSACLLLIDTLPDFMQRGAVDLDDLHASPSSSSSASASRGQDASGKRSSRSESHSSPFLGQSLLRRSPWKGKARAQAEAPPDSPDAFTSIYHPSIAFSFRPPLPTLGIGSSDAGADAAASSATSGQPGHPGSGRDLASADDPQHYGPTISFTGRTLYLTSAHILRHALAALFYDTVLTVETARFEGRSKPGQSWPGISASVRGRCDRQDGRSASDDAASNPDHLTIRLRFEGTSRISLAPHTYTVLFRYTFDRETGTIVKHTVDNIQPVPGSKVWAGLTSAWGVLSPCGGAAGGGGGGGAIPETGSRGGGAGKWYMRVAVSEALSTGQEPSSRGDSGSSHHSGGSRSCNSSGNSSGNSGGSSFGDGQR
ncbi:hypothetical protein ACQY0O_008433 [Thecaphora frezii]